MTKKFEILVAHRTVNGVPKSQDCCRNFEDMEGKRARMNLLLTMQMITTLQPQQERAQRLKAGAIFGPDLLGNSTVLTKRTTFYSSHPLERAIKIV